MGRGRDNGGHLSGGGSFGGRGQASGIPTFGDVLEGIAPPKYGKRAVGHSVNATQSAYKHHKLLSSVFRATRPLWLLGTFLATTGHKRTNKRHWAALAMCSGTRESRMSHV